MIKQLSARAASSSFALSLVAGLAVAPGVAQAGFFEQLFGMQAAPAQAPVENAPASENRSHPTYAPRVHRPRKHVALGEVKSGRQTPTDLMHDVTLRTGDAVMMKDGIHIYEGDRASNHDNDEFVALDVSRDVTSKKRLALLLVDTTKGDALRSDIVPDGIASGRSASDGATVNPGFKITDVRGKSVRYVGP